MVKNEKGFTIIELLAVVVISSIIIVPLMFSLVGNINTNKLLHTRRSSVSLAEGAVYGFDKLSYPDINSLLTASTDNYIEFDSTTCTQLSASDDQTICDVIFGSEFSNVSFDENHFKVYIYDYNMTSTIQSQLVIDPSIPAEVQEVIGLLTPSTDPNPGLIRLTVWINYSDDPYNTIVVSGLLLEGWSDPIYE
ncbi:hypothetical protein KQ51_01103 [Candidatus Izimaplasma bacterium HR1]|jgi:prepilin-type N-terminal cleavage/methylation domain-containing protein|uniref:prepilin-type N-terminal cleavage/methylation domain-containing protein n=1 Tax=Candidatus Izimoplasma sp. HR1 TaxID=1541959 RepID=UPI0004F66413|nr:hypothetical protein KQ51_01103 [Candidatus Izimaplasma bacterium HR1]